MSDLKPARPVVLIVDDVQDIRASLRMALEDEFQVLEAWNAQVALDWLKRVKVDAVLTDLYMPGDLDGVGLIQSIQKRPAPRPAIIAISGSPNLAYRSSLQTARYVGADVTLTKPVKRDDLIRTVRGLLEGGQRH